MRINFANKAAAQPGSASGIPTELKLAVRSAVADNASADSLIESHQTPETREPTLPASEPVGEPTPSTDEPVSHESHDTADRIEEQKLSRLVSDDFPFDESQVRAIEGITKYPYACMTGAAGTGKTTTTKKIVDTLIRQGEIGEVNIGGYFPADQKAAEDPDSVIQERYIPSVCLVGFTGRSAQMIKRNFPRDWHENIMTIHRMLAYRPEYYYDEDDMYGVDGELKMKMRFVPSYTAEVKLPWDIIIIDEAGMLGLDLWHQIWAAAKKGCRIYMIGDINQLPPVHGRSVFGFAMAKWPSYELTHIHRQQGENNEIVDNAWRILKGQVPVSGGRFQMIELKGDASHASKLVRKLIPTLKDRGIFDPDRDTIITPINGEEGSRGVALGQIALNQSFALIFNPQTTHPRFIIDGGREKKQLAVGDKVMATKNDHQAGITNGMTGIITDIVAHAGYGGDPRRFGLVADVNAYYAATGEEDAGVDFTLDELNESMEAIDAGQQAKREKTDRGPSSHVVTVRFGDGEHSFEIPFSTLAEVGSLQTAYVVTCHKMQGGESPVIVIICHDALKQMMNREWLYTAVTRASEKCILLYSPTALRTAISKQSIKGTTLKQKIEMFNRLQTDNGLGKSVNVTLPEIEGGFEDDSNREYTDESDADWGDSGGALTVAPKKESGLAFLAAKAKQRQQEQPTGERVNRVEIHHHHIITEVHYVEKEQPATPKDVDLREVQPEAPAEPKKIRLDTWGAHLQIVGTAKDYLRLPAPAPVRLLTHQPTEPAKPKNPWAARLAKQGA